MLKIYGSNLFFFLTLLSAFNSEAQLSCSNILHDQENIEYASEEIQTAMTNWFSSDRGAISQNNFINRRAPGIQITTDVYSRTLNSGESPLRALLQNCAPELLIQNGENYIINPQGRLPSAKVFTERFISYAREVLKIPDSLLVKPGKILKKRDSDQLDDYIFLDHLQRAPEGYEEVTGAVSDILYYSAIDYGVLPVTWSSEFNETFKILMIFHEFGHVSSTLDLEYLRGVRFLAKRMKNLLLFIENHASSYEKERKNILHVIDSVYDYFENYIGIKSTSRDKVSAFLSRFEIGEGSFTEIPLSVATEEGKVSLSDFMQDLKKRSRLLLGKKDDERQRVLGTYKEFDERALKLSETLINPLVLEVLKILNADVIWLGGSLADGMTLTSYSYTEANPYFKFYRDNTYRLLDPFSKINQDLSKRFPSLVEDLIMAVRYLNVRLDSDPQTAAQAAWEQALFVAQSNYRSLDFEAQNFEN